ncbi:MAG: 23S rRNA (guanosine(2251)-2'-O)-methyltransferase RlmB [Clostridia bacterium]|nr:23S rRNA (guanosine(2251)-2'-O)-methyltransferase RlmB [Clostridia bacterium]
MKEIPKKIEKKTEQIEGRNSVRELLKSGNDVNKLYIQKGEKHGSIIEIVKLAKEKKIVIVEEERYKLDQMSETKNHQGVIASVPPYNYYTVDDIIKDAKEKNEQPFIIVLDGIEDPHNLGSIIRTAVCAGVHGVIIPKRRSVLVNSTVNKASAGAVQYMKIARVNNLNDTIKYLKEKDVWIYGTDVKAEKFYYEEKYDTGVALIIGSEGTGMSRLVKENCDILVKIPMTEKINSLNASVSAGIIMYEIANQRRKN